MRKQVSISLALFVLFVPALCIAGKDISNYTLRVQIIRMTSERRQPYRPPQEPYEAGEELYYTAGQGNIAEGDTAHAFDFTYKCYADMRPTAETVFPARWKNPQHELELLIPVFGKSGKYDTCDVSTVVHEGVYFPDGGKTLELSQSEYSRWKTRHDQEMAAERGTSDTPIALLTVRSYPSRADIQVDGVFMGSTPSLLDLPVGAHTITVIKQGFTPWERKMLLTTGRIAVDADLGLGRRN